MPPVVSVPESQYRYVYVCAQVLIPSSVRKTLSPVVGREVLCSLVFLIFVGIAGLPAALAAVTAACTLDFRAAGPASRRSFMKVLLDLGIGEQGIRN